MSSVGKLLREYLRTMDAGASQVSQVPTQVHVMDQVRIESRWGLVPPGCVPNSRNQRGRGGA